MTEETKKRYRAAIRACFEKYYGERLNAMQTEAVLSVKGPLLILAGAGSGKTTVLVNRICHIIKFGTVCESDFLPDGASEEDIFILEEAARSATHEELEELLSTFIHHPCPPWAMLAITFTNKAANEIKERLARALGDENVAKEIWAGTFHSVCVRMLRRFGDRVGLSEGFSIYDTQDKKRLVSETMKDLGIDEKMLPLRAVMSAISAEKDNLRAPEEMNVGASLRDKHIQRIYTAYQAKLEKNNAVDFDDIIMKTVKLLENNEDVLSYYQGKFSYVCVDEYQDTNPAQFRLTALLSAAHRNIMVVGDDDQSIYKFRGATIENILSFDRTYADAKVIKLEQNYRSTKTILDAANAVIAHNDDRHKKTLWCDKEEGERITVRECDTADAECRYIIDTVLHRVVHERRKYSDFAVLYRVNEISRSLETALAKSGIPYRLLGGMRFYDRKEIKDILAYLYLILNPSDDGRLRRVINEPKRKIGDKTVETVTAVAEEMGVSMMEVMRFAAEHPALSKSAPKLLEFVSLIDTLREDAKLLAPSLLIKTVMEKTGYEAMLKAGGEAMKSDLDNLGELISAAAEYEAKAEGEPTLLGFLEEAALVSDIDKYDENAEAMVLMTIHSAKGLEFPVVFLAGAEEDIFPGMQSIMNPSEMSEERRLAYVAITRAKEKLFVTHARERMMYGTTQHHRPSRFIEEEVPAHLKETATPRRAGITPQPYRPAAKPSLSGEMGRRPTLSTANATKPKASTTFAVGDRVRHTIFGTGQIIGARAMGGDTLYEVRFDNGEVKKLMATYAKLTLA